MDATKILVVEDEADFEPPIIRRLENIETIDREARVRNWRRKPMGPVRQSSFTCRRVFRTMTC